MKPIIKHVNKDPYIISGKNSKFIKVFKKLFMFPSNKTENIDDKININSLYTASTLNEISFLELNKYFPISKFTKIIKGKVHGLPTKFPIIDATILHLNNHAKKIPIKKCIPKNGVIADATPKLKPNAILCGLPGNLFILNETYFISLFQPDFGQIKE
tara:strand:- start:4917 stop:5390 length:474 start_codon:yes stop_codon:yes gene_type:complete